VIGCRRHSSRDSYPKVRKKVSLHSRIRPSRVQRYMPARLFWKRRR